MQVARLLVGIRAKSGLFVLKKPACRGSPRINSIASRCEGCTDSPQNRCQRRTCRTQVLSWILTRIGAICTIRRDGADSQGPQAVRHLWGEICRDGRKRKGGNDRKRDAKALLVLAPTTSAERRDRDIISNQRDIRVREAGKRHIRLQAQEDNKAELQSTT